MLRVQNLRYRVKDLRRGADDRSRILLDTRRRVSVWILIFWIWVGGLGRASWAEGVGFVVQRVLP